MLFVGFDLLLIQIEELDVVSSELIRDKTRESMGIF